MSGLFGTMQTAKLGMFAQQSALNTTSHNIANVNTPGYSRQHVTLATARPITLAGPGQIGTGVNVVSITRTRDTFLDYQVRRASSDLANALSKEKYLSQIEGIYNEPSDTGISKLLSEYYDAWQTLSLNPEKLEARQVVVQTAKQLTDAINQKYKQLNDTQTNLETEKVQVVDDVNNLLDQINEINKQIKEVSLTGNNPNDLLDSRDLLLDELSTKFGIDARSTELNGIKLKVDGVDIDLIHNTDSDPTYHLKYDEATKEYKFVEIDEKGEEIAGTEKDFAPKGGTIGGLLELDGKVQDNIDQLNKLAKTIALSTNAIHSDGGDNRNFFAVKNPDGTITDKDGSDLNSGKELNAGNITINDDLLNDPMLINTGLDSASGATDGSRALVIAQLRDLAFIIDNKTDGVNNDTTLKEFKDKNGYGEISEGIITFKNNKNGAKTEGYYNGIINKLGIETQTAKRDVKKFQERAAAYIQMRESTSGVSMDEETINLIQFQRTYQANAKMITTVDELLDVVVNGLKR
ncbi:MAG: flagellar hook-associated protein FlgK [Clostridium sp.]